MAKIARVGDLAAGTCTAHGSVTPWTGAILTGSPIANVEGSAMAIIGSTGNTSCGHHFRVTGGSSVVTAAGIGVARQGDAVIVIEGGSGTITGGSSTSNCA